MNDICKETGAYLRDSLEGHFFDKALAESISDLLRQEGVSSVYDLGCGHGEYTRHLRNDSFECSGFDGNPYTNNITSGLCNTLNLSQHINLPAVDAVICLEVGEHVPAKFEQILVENISKSTSNILILSWAVEGQVGEGHVNCRNNDYIKEVFESKGFRNLPDYEIKLRQDSTLSWFKNTIMVFKK